MDRDIEDGEAEKWAAAYYYEHGRGGRIERMSAADAALAYEPDDYKRHHANGWDED